MLLTQIIVKNEIGGHNDYNSIGGNNNDKIVDSNKMLKSNSNSQINFLLNFL